MNNKAQSKIAMQYDLRQNNNRGSSSFGKWYAHAVRRSTLNTRGLSDYIMAHGSVYTRDVVEGMVIKLRESIVELLMQGVGVKLEGLGTFYPTFECTGADSADEFDINQNLKGVHMRFKPERTKDEDITSRSFKQKCIMKRLQSVDALASTDSGSDSEEPIVENPGD